MRKTETFIDTDEKLLTVIRSPIRFETACKIVKRYLNVSLLFFTSTTEDIDQKAVLVQNVEDYFERFKDVPREDKPMFLFQKTLDFDINDIYKGSNK